MQKKSFTLSQLAQMTNSKLIGDPNYIITSVSDLESALPEDASFLSNPRYETAMKKSNAGVIFVHPQITLSENRNFLIAENPSRAFQQVIEAFYDSTEDISGFQGIHPTAIIHPTAKIGNNVSIGPYCVIDKNCVVEANTLIGPFCSLGPHVKVGTDCVLHAHVTLRERSVIKNRVILQPGVVIGSCGFGYTTDYKTGRHSKLNQIGNVEIEDDVEIGANTTIDRGRFKTTKIGRGTKIDNLVQIGHAVAIGPDNIIVAQTGIAGSTQTGRNVVIGGQVAVNGHIKLADGVMVAARSGITKSIPQGGKYGGVPAAPIQEFNRNSVYLKNIERYVDELHQLKERIAELEIRCMNQE